MSIDVIQQNTNLEVKETTNNILVTSETIEVKNEKN